MLNQKKKAYNSNSRAGAQPPKDPKDVAAQKEAKGAGVKLSEDKVLGNLNQVILDHLETAGFSKIAKLLKDEMVKSIQGTAQSESRKASGINSARGRQQESKPTNP